MVLAAAAAAEGDETRAAMESHAAVSALERIGAWHRSDDRDHDRGRAPATGTAGESARRPELAETVFRLDGDTRTVAFDGHEVLLRDLKGMRYLARLLGQPGREFHVLDIVGAEAGGGRSPDAAEDGLSVMSGDGLGPVLDDQARAAYRRRLAEVDDDIDEATRRGDTERAALAAADRGYLVTELSRAFGLGGRARVSGATSERARASVTRSLRYALARIAEHHPQLAEHLDQTVRTGTYCSYVPDPRVPIRWHV